MRAYSILGVGSRVAIALAVIACRENKLQMQSSAGGEVAEAWSGISRVSDIVSNPQRYAGRTVIVEADVDTVLSRFAFMLGAGSPLPAGIDGRLIVAYPRSLDLEPFDGGWRGNKVRVRGTVQRMSIADLERELGRDLNPRLEVEFMKQPVLLGRSLGRLSRP